jgi:hypothetical protein
VSGFFGSCVGEPLKRSVGWFVIFQEVLMTNQLVRLATLALAIIANAMLLHGQTNLLKNPNADLQSQFWRPYGEATIETCASGNPCFVVRNGGYFLQDVTLPDGSVGQYAVLVGRGASERINSDGAITGLPYLYGYMMREVSPRDGRISDYLQGQTMLASPARESEWVPMWGLFRVPEGTGAIRFFLKQALRNGVPHNGSAGRFDDVGLYLFASEQDACAFANARH